jgi:hypothetical protein
VENVALEIGLRGLVDKKELAGDAPKAAEFASYLE